METELVLGHRQGLIWAHEDCSHPGSTGALSARHVLLGMMQDARAHFFMTMRFLFLLALELFSPHVSLLIKKLPGAFYLGSSSSGRCCFVVYPVCVPKCVGWVSENTREVEPKVTARNLPNVPGSVGGTRLTPSLLFPPLPPGKLSCPLPVFTPNFNDLLANSLHMLISLSSTPAVNLRVNPPLPLPNPGLDFPSSFLPFLV